MTDAAIDAVTAEVGEDGAIKGDAKEDFARFCRSRFWCEVGERPGFRAVDSPIGPVIPVFTSEYELARFCGAVRWLSTIGADLLDLVPPGYRFVVNPGSEGSRVLNPQATRRVLKVTR